MPPRNPVPCVVLVRRDAEVACWPLPAGQNPDFWVVDQLARLQLVARRLGYSLQLRGAPSQLRELIELAGLSDIITDAAGPVSTDPAGPVSTGPAGPVSTDPAGPAGEPDDDGTVAGGPG